MVFVPFSREHGFSGRSNLPYFSAGACPSMWTVEDAGSTHRADLLETTLSGFHIPDRVKGMEEGVSSEHGFSSSLSVSSDGNFLSEFLMAIGDGARIHKRSNEDIDPSLSTDLLETALSGVFPSKNKGVDRLVFPSLGRGFVVGSPVFSSGSGLCSAPAIASSDPGGSILLVVELPKSWVPIMIIHLSLVKNPVFIGSVIPAQVSRIEMARSEEPDLGFSVIMSSGHDLKGEATADLKIDNAIVVDAVSGAANVVGCCTVSVLGSSGLIQMSVGFGLESMLGLPMIPLDDIDRPLYVRAFTVADAIDNVNSMKVDTRSAAIAEGSPKMGSVHAGIARRVVSGQARNVVTKGATVGLSINGPVCASLADPGIVITGVAGKKVDPRSDSRSSYPVGSALTSSKSSSLDLGGDDTIDAVVADSGVSGIAFNADAIIDAAGAGVGTFRQEGRCARVGSGAVCLVWVRCIPIGVRFLPHLALQVQWSKGIPGGFFPCSIWINLGHFGGRLAFCNQIIAVFFIRHADWTDRFGRFSSPSGVI